ncbi:MAG: hypothetical protein ACLRMJ_05950 [Alistipes finegoldii]
MPSSYYNFRYGSSFTYATAYDPAFYNIIISGDEVWVEPKYITRCSNMGRHALRRLVFRLELLALVVGLSQLRMGRLELGLRLTWYDPWWGPGWHPYWDPVGGPDGAAAGMDITMRDTGPATITAIPADAAGATLPAEALRGAVRQRRLCRRFARRPQRLLQHQLRQPQRRQSVQQRLARQQLQQPGQQLQ